METKMFRIVYIYIIQTSSRFASFNVEREDARHTT